MAARLKIAVVAWDISHNAVARAYFTADMLFRQHDAYLVGPSFSLTGHLVWPPIGGAVAPTSYFKVTSTGEYVSGAIALAQTCKCDLVYIIKPRFPGMLLGSLISQFNKCPILLDIDEDEMAFVTEQATYSDDDWSNLYGRMWTYACSNLIRYATNVTVSNPALQKRFGGFLVRHARDECIYDPTLFSKPNNRKMYGYRDDQKVALFLGTPRRHKGVVRIATMLAEIRNDRLIYCIAGASDDDDLDNEIKSVKGVQIDRIGSQPLWRGPALLSMADVVCLFQDPHQSISKTQVPAKLAECLAMNLPVITTPCDALLDVIESGYVGCLPYEAQGASLLGEWNRMLPYAENNSIRQYFLREFSYSSNLDRLIPAVHATMGVEMSDEKLGLAVINLAKVKGIL